jgi:hypothetical protein
MNNLIHTKRATLVLFMLLTGFIAQAQNRQNRKVDAFRGVNISGALSATIRQGSQQSVEVEADEDILDKIITEVRGGVLKVYREDKANWKLFRNKNIRVYITCPELTSLEVHGASSVKGESDFVANDFKLTASGASHATLSLSTKKLNTHVSGASNVKISGRADSQQIDLSGASSYEAFDLVSNVAEVDASGASSAKIQVEEELSADVSGASGIRYKGSPRMRNVQSSGASSIKKGV